MWSSSISQSSSVRSTQPGSPFWNYDVNVCDSARGRQDMASLQMSDLQGLLPNFYRTSTRLFLRFSNLLWSFRKISGLQASARFCRSQRLPGAVARGVRESIISCGGTWAPLAERISAALNFYDNLTSPPCSHSGFIQARTIMNDLYPTCSISVYHSVS